MNRFVTTTCALASAALLIGAISGIGSVSAKPSDVRGAESTPLEYTARYGSDASSLGFVMNKWMDPKGEKKVGVKGTFHTYAVELNRPVASLKTLSDLDGLKARIVVDLASVDTANPARNLNVITSYFETKQFAQAVVDLAHFRAVGTTTPGAVSAEVLADGNLTMHGITMPLSSAHLKVSKSPSGIEITTLAPISVASVDYELSAAALMKVCGHAGLDPAAAVTVTLALHP